MTLEVERELGMAVYLPQICHFCGEPITKLSGLDPDSLLIHHITYIPEVVVPAHRRCNSRYHKEHPDHSKNPEIEYRKRFIESLKGDVACYFCGEPITKMNGRVPESLTIHSLDGDHPNWDPSNKVPAHNGCHMKYHVTGDNNPMNRPEVVAKISKALTGRDAYWMRGDNNVMKRPEALETHSKAIKDSWIKRKEKYGPSGVKDPVVYSIIMRQAMKEHGENIRGDNNPAKRPEVRKKISKANRGNSDIGYNGSEARWKTRRERYGTSGRKNNV